MVKNGQVIAVNVKSDGIAEELKRLWLTLAPECHPFAFDMSVPDTISYLKCSFPFFERQSEYERFQVWASASGYWLDGFDSVWFNREVILSLLKSNKVVCVVSPELHGREYLSLWHELKDLMNAHPERVDQIWLCTDYPFVADRFFNQG